MLQKRVPSYFDLLLMVSIRGALHSPERTNFYLYYTSVLIGVVLQPANGSSPFDYVSGSRAADWLSEGGRCGAARPPQTGAES